MLDWLIARLASMGRCFVQRVSKCLVIGNLLFVIKQTESCCRNLIRQLLGHLRLFAVGQIVQERQLFVSRRVDDVRVIFIDRDPQQPIVIRRLLVRWNPEPFVERIKHFNVFDDVPSIGGWCAAGCSQRRLSYDLAAGPKTVD